MKLKLITRKDWINALLSGKFRQAKEVLTNGNGAYCCLGVACKLAGLKSRNECMILTDGKTELESYEGTNMPKTLAKALGLKSNDRKLLASMNDGEDEYRKHSFKEIAMFLQGKLKPVLKDK